MENYLASKPFGHSLANKITNKQPHHNATNEKPKQIQRALNKNCLSNIVELTQQYEQGKTMVNQRIPNQNQISSHKQSINDQGEQENRSLFIDYFKNIVKRSVNCCKITWDRIYKQATSPNVNVEQSQISQMIEKLRKKRTKKLALLPELDQQASKKRTLVLELDETLIYVSSRKLARYDIRLQYLMDGKIRTVYIVKRFGLDSFLFQMKQFYEIVVFSTLRSELVESILGVIDPKKNISHYLTRQHCISINKSYFIKPLKDIGRDCKNVIAIDSRAITAALNPENLYKIEPFRGSIKDRKLIKLTYFLRHLTQQKLIKSITPIELLRRQFQSKQVYINIREKDKQNDELVNKSQTSHEYQISQSSLHRKSKSQIQPMLKNQRESFQGNLRA